MASVDDLAQHFSTQININAPSTSNPVSPYIKFIRIEEMEIRIPFFDGTNIEVTRFIDECEAVYRVTHPLNFVKLGYIVHSKIVGEAAAILDQVEINYHCIILELKRRYCDPKLLDWMNEFYVTKQAIYENPMQYCKRLQKMVKYAREMYYKTLPKMIADNQLQTIERTALKMFLTKLYDSELKEKLEEQYIIDLDHALIVTEDVYATMNMLHILNSSDVWRNTNGNCPHCEDSEYHYSDCVIHENSLFQNFCIDMKLLAPS
ncbi:hypothetical protein M0804_006437 [Polistes exclamans]|nr:hypothetical protein M0804_006437 [Polistes exclamans]